MKRTTCSPCPRRARADATPGARLAALAARPVRLVLGLMSGTSADGVDGCLVRLEGHGWGLRWRILGHGAVAYPRVLRERVLRCMGPRGTVEDLCRLNVDLGAVFARAAAETAAAASVSLDRVDLVGCHGQTVRHRPPRSGRAGSTLQTGSAAVVAELTGRPVVADFRSADLAAGGQGAPLVPVADRLLFSLADRAVALQNVGGIANVTLLAPRGSPREPVAFDTGPGNMLIDLAAARASGGRERMDRDGRRAARGRVLKPLLGWLMEHPYLRRRPPKSTGREEFGLPLFKELVRRAGRAAPDDLVATATAFTAASIADACRRWLPADLQPDRLLVAGGGARNGTLLAYLAALLAPVRVEPLGGLDPLVATCREALCFAVLADATVAGLAGSCPGVTGARHLSVAGAVAFPPTWARAS